MTRTRTRLASALVAATFVTALLGGCSRSDPEPTADETTTTSSSTTTTPPTDAMVTIGQDAEADLGLTRDQGLCLGRSLVERVGEDEALTLNESDDRLDQLPDDQLEAVRTAFNDCVPGDALAEDVTRQFYAANQVSTQPDQEVFDCVADALEGRAGDVALEGLRASTPASELAVTTEALDGCIPVTVIEELFLRLFAASDLTPQEASCAANQVAREISLQQLLTVAQDGSDLPTEVRDAARDAVAKCL